MRRSIVSALSGLICSILFVGCVASPTNEYILKGIFTDADTPDYVILTYTAEGQQHIDTATVSGGSFGFRGTIEEPAVGYLVSVGGVDEGTRVNLYVEPGIVTVTAGKNFSDAVVTGSRTKDDKDKWEEINRGAWGPTDELMKWYTSLSQEEQNVQANRDRFLSESIRLKAEYADLAASFIREHPDSWYALDAVYRNAVGLVAEYDRSLEIFNYFTPNVRNTPTGLKTQEKIEGWKAIRLGAVAPDFTLFDQYGNPWKLSDMRGKYIFIDFWASWCGACRLENPNVLKAYDALKDKGFTVVGVSIDDNDEKGRVKWVQAIDEDGMPWVQLINNEGENNEVAKVYSVNVVPQNFLIDPQGKIIAKSIYGENLTETIRGLMESGR